MGGTNEIINEIAADSTPIPPNPNICGFGCGCDCDCDCGKCGQALCIAKSVCSSNIIIDTSPPPSIPLPLPLAALSSSVSVTIPANSCITKIYASMPNAPQKAKYILIEIVDGSSNKFFCHALPNQPGTGITFDTTLVQPLCVGTTDATATVTALDQNNKPVEEFLTLTVVYCPNCC